MYALEVKEVSYTYEDNHQSYEALRKLSFHVSEGEFVVLVGPSGCGKSTLLSLLAGLQFPTEGEVLEHGSHITEPSVKRAIVFQNYSLFPFMTILKNVMFGICQADKQITKSAAKEKAIYFLEKVGLAEHLNKYPYQMSGGMKQRTAIARTLAMDADILLMDEPFGALDPKMRLELQMLLESLWRGADKKKTVVFVTHDIDEALVLADRILFIDEKQIKREIAVDFERPRGLDTLLTEDHFCGMRKQLISLFQNKQDEEYRSEEKCCCS